MPILQCLFTFTAYKTLRASFTAKVVRVMWPRSKSPNNGNSHQPKMSTANSKKLSSKVGQIHALELSRMVVILSDWQPRTNKVVRQLAKERNQHLRDNYLCAVFATEPCSYREVILQVFDAKVPKTMNCNI
jgi:hypothetical protein